MWPRAGLGGNPGAGFIPILSLAWNEAIRSRHFGLRKHEIMCSIRPNEALRKMKSYVFKVVVEPDRFEDGREAWHASCPALKGCHTWGHSYEEALANIREAIDLYVQDLIEAGEPIPVDQGTIELPEPAVVVHV